VSAGAFAVAVFTVVLVVAVVVVLARQGHPSGSTDPQADEPAGPDESGRLYEGVDRPAGPDAEDDPGPAGRADR
jgi:hypothetical protein